MIPIQCLSLYRNPARRLVFEPGLHSVEESVAEFLLRDAPGTFALVPAQPPVVVKAFRTPARHTAILTPDHTKAEDDEG